MLPKQGCNFVSQQCFLTVTENNEKEKKKPLLNLSGLDLQNSTITWMLILMFSEVVQFVMNKFRG